MSSEQLTYDDRDSSVFQYTGDWWTNGVWSASNGQSGTLSGTNDPNGYLIFTFPTPAVSFTYYGIRRSHGGLYGVCADCDINSSSFTTIDAFNASDNGQNPPVALYSQTWPQAALHTILIKNEADSRGTPVGNSQLVVDRVVLGVLVQSSTSTTTTSAQAPTAIPQPPTTTTTSSTSTSHSGTTSTTGSSLGSSSSSGGTTGAISTVTNASSGSGSPSGSSMTDPGALTSGLSSLLSSSSSGAALGATTSGSSSGSSSSSNMGAIIGAVVGSLAVVSLILLIVFCLRRRRRTKPVTTDKQSQATANAVPRSPPPITTVDPFAISSGTEPSSAPTSQSDGSTTLPVSNTLSSKISKNSMEKRRSLHQRRLPSVPQASSSIAAQAWSPPPSISQGRAEDGGSLSVYTMDEDLPPHYSQLYSS